MLCSSHIIFAVPYFFHLFQILKIITCFSKDKSLRLLKILWLKKFPFLLKYFSYTVYYIWMKAKVLITQSCPTLWDPIDCSPPDSSVHGILWTRILEWVAISSSRVSFWPRDQTWISSITGRFFTTELPGKLSFFLSLSLSLYIYINTYTYVHNIHTYSLQLNTEYLLNSSLYGWVCFIKK